MNDAIKRGAIPADGDVLPLASLNPPASKEQDEGGAGTPASPPQSAVDWLTTTVCGLASHRVGKSFCFAPEEGPDAIFRDPSAPGRWRRPKEFGENDAKLPARFVYELYSTPDLAARAALRTQLATDNRRVLMMGVLADGVQPGVPLPRNQRVLKDAPRPTLTIDLEDIKFPGVDVVEESGELHWHLWDVFERADLDFLRADCILHLSSSIGLFDKSEVRVHLEWWLPEPKTLAQQKGIAEFITQKLQKSGIGGKADVTIYEPARLLFTGPPLLTRRDWVEGSGFQVTELARPVSQIVRLVPGGAAAIVIPPEVLRRERYYPTEIFGVRLPNNKAPKGLRPENVYAPVRARIFATAKRAPMHRREQLKREIQERLRAEIAAVPAKDEAQRLKRLSWVQDEQFERSWNGAIAKRYSFIAPEQGQGRPREGGEISKVRAAIASFLEMQVRRATMRERRELPWEDGQPPKPRHQLIPLPPGTGKTQAIVKALTARVLTGHRVHYLTPRIDLSKDVLQAAKANLPQDEYLQGLPRHHLGRSKLCSEPELDRAAQRFEQIGLSPYHPICVQHCKKHDTCPWPAQRADAGSGLVIMQHANMHGLVRQNPEGFGVATINIIDESLLNVVLGKAETRKIISLRRSYVVRRNRDGRMMTGATADVRASRDAMVELLERCRGQVLCSTLTWLQAPLTLTDKEGQTETKPKVKWCQLEEAEVRRQHLAQMQAAYDAHLAAKANGASGATHSRAFARAIRQLQVSQFFAELYRAIEGSLRVPARTHVIGLRVVGSEARSIRVHIRTDLPLSWMMRDGLWLDGTADPDIWQACFGERGRDGTMEPLIMELKVKPGAYHLTQFADKPYSKSWFSKSAERVAQLLRFIWYQAGAHPAGVFVAVQEGLERRLKKHTLPANVEIGHFNNLSGKNDWKRCSCAIIVGRSLPSVTDLELMTEALYYDDDEFTGITSQDGERLSGRELIQTRAGPYSIPGEKHRDLRCSKLKHAITDAQVKQAIHRLRLYDRDEPNAAKIFAFGQWDTGLVVDEVLCDWSDADYDVADVIIKWRVAPTNELLRELPHGLCAELSDRSIERLWATIRDRLSDASASIPANGLINNIKGTTPRELIKANGGNSCISQQWRQFRVHLEGRAGVDVIAVDAASPAEATALIESVLGKKVVGTPADLGPIAEPSIPTVLRPVRVQTTS